MYKIVVADDEKLARDVVIKYILFLHLNFEIVGRFSNGSDALDYIKDYDVDVVITDIKMPKMSGMELCKHICAIKPKCKIVILSGYGEFTYARQAIEYNVFNYLLKPLDLDELTDVLTRLNTILDEETVVAEHVYLNAAYFSRYFSTKTGRSFSDYLLDLRMKKAMELLGENVKIYQVGERVGYRNNRIFLRTFKKYTGYTPSEYRLHVLKKEE